MYYETLDEWNTRIRFRIRIHTRPQRFVYKTGQGYGVTLWTSNHRLTDILSLVFFRQSVKLAHWNQQRAARGRERLTIDQPHDPPGGGGWAASLDFQLICVDGCVTTTHTHTHTHTHTQQTPEKRAPNFENKKGSGEPPSTFGTRCINPFIWLPNILRDTFAERWYAKILKILRVCITYVNMLDRFNIRFQSQGQSFGWGPTMCIAVDHWRETKSSVWKWQQRRRDERLAYES